MMKLFHHRPVLKLFIGQVVLKTSIVSCTTLTYIVNYNQYQMIEQLLKMKTTYFKNYEFH